MRVGRNFERVYAEQEDPWGIGRADSERYDLYVRLLHEAAGPREKILDIGCGFGALLARFNHEFDRLTGIEVSSIAVEKGRKRFPFIQFEQGSADALEVTAADREHFDAILYSDVIAYLNDRAKNRSLAWISAHLSEGGVALIAAWSPGGRYLTYDELRRLVARHLMIADEEMLESDHAVFICQAKARKVAFTVDYETWQPVPAGRKVDWDRDVLQPTAALLEVFDAEGAPLTLFAEMGEYLWLRERDPALAERMAEQWRDAVRRGHDVQLHLHPTWLPELGADLKDGEWHWDWRWARVHDVPGDLTEVVAQCRAALEEAIRPADPGYRVRCFRAGAYEAQPFTRLADALVANGILCDSSVYAGPGRPGRLHNYSLACSRHQPYFASRFDPQLPAPPAEEEIIELPIFSPEPGRRWTFDGDEGSRFPERLLDWVQSRHPTNGNSSEAYRRRREARARIARAYTLLRTAFPGVNAVLPGGLGRLLGCARDVPMPGHEYYVLVGHTKSDLDPTAIAAGLRRLMRQPTVEIMTLSAMAGDAEAELRRNVTPTSGVPISLPEDGRLLARHALAARIPLDRSRVITLTEPSEAEQLPTGEADCVVADEVLALADDPSGELDAIASVLAPGGILLTSIPSDARAPREPCPRHPWRTFPDDVATRLRAAGFTSVAIEEVDAFRELDAPPHPPSHDRLMLVRAWCRDRPLDPSARVDELLGWVYRALDPERPAVTDDPEEILGGGHAWCAGYAIVLGEALRREGFPVRWVSMIAESHPRGRGETLLDTHEVLEVRIPDGARHVLDPMSGVRFSSPLEQLLADPGLADFEREQDERYRSRGYDLYATSFWYSRVRMVATREDRREPWHYVPRERLGEPLSRGVRMRRAHRRARRQLGRLRDRLLGRP